MDFIYDKNLFKLMLIPIGFVLTLTIYFKYKFTYWYRQNIPYISPSFPFGNFKKIFTGEQSVAEISRDLHHALKSKGHKFGGVFFLQTPVFIPVDPVHVKQILSTDFEYFSERGVYFNEKNDPLAAHLFNLPTEPWKILRSKLTPTFTSGKIKMMFETMLKCSNDMMDACMLNQSQPIDINDLSVRYTVDIIGTCAFGIDCNSLKNPDERFKLIAERIINPPIWTGLKTFLSLISPNLLKICNLNIMEEPVKHFFLDVVQQTERYRERNGVSRNDFFQLLIDMKKRDEKVEGTSGMKMTMRLAAAQTFVFFAAGFETSSMTINLCLFELSRNPEIQDKVRAEIRKVMKENGGQITYEGLKAMVYLECAIQETMRKYPPLAFLNRIAVRNYKIPGTDVILKKGSKVLVSLMGLHMDPDYYPDPDRFDPDRFSDENKASRTPFTYMPFGDGHRICIGARFGQVTTKVCLATLLRQFQFDLNPMTKLPISYRATSFVLSLADPIWLNVTNV